MMIPVKLVEQLLIENGAEKYDKNEGNLQIWIKDGVIIVQLPENQPVDLEIVQMIALEQLELSFLEFDYWMGQNGLR